MTGKPKAPTPAASGTTNSSETDSKLVVGASGLGDDFAPDYAAALYSLADQLQTITAAHGLDMASTQLRILASNIRKALAAQPAPGVGGLLERAYEVVHHDEGCPSIGGNGDKDCRCDAVPFLRDLKAALTTRPAESVAQGAPVVPRDYAMEHAEYLAQGGMGGEWLPIESAPKDGTLIDVYAPPPWEGRCTDVKWGASSDPLNSTRAKEWVFKDEFVGWCPVGVATHWMPRPKKPAATPTPATGSGGEEG